MLYVVFVSSEQIADFGLSNLYHKDKLLQTFCGSPLYASPEIVNGRPYRGPEVRHPSDPEFRSVAVFPPMPQGTKERERERE